MAEQDSTEKAAKGFDFMHVRQHCTVIEKNIASEYTLLQTQVEM